MRFLSPSCQKSLLDSIRGAPAHSYLHSPPWVGYLARLEPFEVLFLLPARGACWSLLEEHQHRASSTPHLGSTIWLDWNHLRFSFSFLPEELAGSHERRPAQSYTPQQGADNIYITLWTGVLCGRPPGYWQHGRQHLRLPGRIGPT